MWKRNKPASIQSLVANLNIEMLVRLIFCKNQGISFGGFDLLVIITDRWLNEGKGSTAYWLSKEPKNCSITATSVCLRGLLEKGLVEIGGKGNKQCNIYIPSKTTLIELSKLLSA